MALPPMFIHFGSPGGYYVDKTDSVYRNMETCVIVAVLLFQLSSTWFSLLVLEPRFSASEFQLNHGTGKCMGVLDRLTKAGKTGHLRTVLGWEWNPLVKQRAYKLSHDKDVKEKFKA